MCSCWLISAIAALAEFPGLIQRVFVTKETTEWGRYEVKLFDISLPNTHSSNGKGSFVNVTIDDRLPCSVDAGFPRTLYLKLSKDGEIWPLILEKAMAKWAGSYENLDGGHAAWALATLTGWDVQSYTHSGGGSWRKCRLSPDLAHPRSPHDVKYESLGSSHSDEEVFELLTAFEKEEHVMCASSGSGNDTVEDSKGGIVQGHAYTLIGAHDVDGKKLVQLRNPWGQFEWKGEWSDGDAKWDEFPKVKAALKPSVADDGIFYMSFENFVKNFRKVDVCLREREVNTDLFLDVQEEDGCAGPAVGCAKGLAKYYAGAGFRLTCGAGLSEVDQARLPWYNRSAGFLWQALKKQREERATQGAMRMEAAAAVVDSI